jgi:hypothetical protein
MKKFDILPHVSAGPIRLGMSREQVKALQLGTSRSFKRVPTQIEPADHFSDLGLMVMYKAGGTVEAVEFLSSGQPVFEGLELFGVSAAKLEDLLRHRDPTLQVEDDGFTSINLGIGGYVSVAEEKDEAPASTTIVFERGYYD